MSERAGRGIVTASFVAAFALTALPLPDWAAAWRPSWAALVLVYWCLALPQRIGVATGWVCGLLLDVLMGTLLGQHALGLSVIAFITHKTHQQVRVFPAWQQAVAVFGLVFVYQTLVFWVNGARGIPVDAAAYVTAPLTSMLLWPWVFIVLRDLGRRYAAP